MKLTDKISWLMGRVPRSLFPRLNKCLPNRLTAQEKPLVSIMEIVQVEQHVSWSVRRYRYPGRKPLDRQACSRAFEDKALYRHPTTSDLRRAWQSAENLRLIFGFATSDAIPSESTLLRAFAKFSVSNLGGRVHDALVKDYLLEELVGLISRDSEAIRELPVTCDRGAKRYAKGYKVSWNGYKLHLDINDIGLPISALVTSSLLHVSQAAIPLIKLTSGKVTYLYDLMDATYDAKRIEETSRKSGHVPITDKNCRG